MSTAPPSTHPEWEPTAVEKHASMERLVRELTKLPQVACPVVHRFAPGMYAREMTIPAGTVILGAVHKTDHLVVISSGRLKLVSGDDATEVEAPFTFTCRAGVKNAVVALTDVTWTNFFPTTETDVDKLVSVLTESTASELLGGENNAQFLFAQTQIGN